MRIIKVLFHDNCFDGAASAALFAQFHKDIFAHASSFSFVGMAHALGDAFASTPFDGDENAVVDFRYSSRPELTWWFDHHQSAFLSPEDERHFYKHPSGQSSGKKFFDPSARSCTKFLADTCGRVFGWQTKPFEDLIGWADLIDGAKFPDAKTAVELAEPALQIMTWIEHNHDEALKQKMIADLVAKPLGEIAEQRYVTDALAPILEQHKQAISTMGRRARAIDGVVEYDIADVPVGAMNKFIVYYLFPDCRYAVGVSQTTSRTKVSVGSNPWGHLPRSHNLASICSRYGGGGHPVVGAVSLPAGQLDRARQIAKEIAEELRHDQGAAVALDNKVKGA